jgi:hypothetical protein
MHPPHLLTTSLLLPFISAQNTSASAPTYLLAPALLTHNNHTIIQCWNLTSPFTRSSTPGVTGAQVATVANTTNLAYNILLPRFSGGLHTAPVPQLVHFISGLAHVTLPQDSATDLWIVGGRGGVLLAVDKTREGHVTSYPGDAETVAIIAPFEDGVVPEYSVVKEGPCEGLQTFV